MNPFGPDPGHRVAPVSADQDPRPRWRLESPLISHPSAPPALEPGFPRGFALPVAPPDATASRLARRTFGFCRRWSFESPRISHPFGASSGLQAPGFPAALFRPLRLAVQLRVAPDVALSGLAGDGASGRPESPILQRLGRVSFGFPRNLAFPRSAYRCSSRVTPLTAPSGCAGDGSSSYPESLVLRRLRALAPGRPRATLSGCAS